MYKKCFYLVDFTTFWILGQKFVYFFHFFGKFKKSNGHSEINWPLEVVAYLAARMTTNRIIPQITNWPHIRITSFFCCKMSFSVSHKEVVSSGSGKRGILSLYQNWIYFFKSSYYQHLIIVFKVIQQSQLLFRLEYWWNSERITHSSVFSDMSSAFHK